MSHKPRLIKVADTAPSETTKADEIAIKTAKTSKVTAMDNFLGWSSFGQYE
jgi:hypothetical protein